jgi:ATP-binding cassette, subfamily G (WHITE), member 2, PDR
LKGLNVEQRKRLTIGVELAAKPDLLLFLDEPTSGLDSQTAWSIASLIRKLSNNGQAILCTIHQPSATLFEMFDRLLLLTKGGQPVYFGELGPDSRSLIDYFEKNGGDPCPVGENPAEWMLKVIGTAPGAHTDINWPHVWRASPEYAEVRKELERLQSNPRISQDSPEDLTTYAAPFRTQFYMCMKRVFQQYWRTPSYIYAKLILSGGTVS